MAAVTTRPAHCPQGHAYEGDNVIIDSKGAIRCRECRREQNRRSKARRRAADVGKVFAVECATCGWSGESMGRPRCLNCGAAYTRRWRERNPERAAEQKRRYRERKDREFWNERKRRQKARNPETYRAAWRRRVTWLAEGDVTEQDLREVFERDGGRCVYCGGEVSPRFRPNDPRGFDHIMPRANGGRHTKANLVVSCGPCNALKGVEEVA